MKSLAIPLVALLLTLSACDNADLNAFQASEEAKAQLGEQMAMAEPEQRLRRAAVADSAEQAAAEAQGQGPLATFAADSPDRYLIKNAQVTLEADDVRTTVRRIEDAVRVAEGYVGESQDHTDSLGRVTAMMVVRVPQQALDGTLQQLESLGRILARQVSSEDVTEEFIDTESRLRNLKRTEERLLDHLSRSSTLEDIFQAEREISRVRGEIERLEGRMRFLEHRVGFSTLRITIQETPKQHAVVPPETFSSGKVFGDATRSLVVVLRNLWAMVIWLAVWSVIWVPLAGLALYAWRRLNRRAGVVQ